MKAENGIDAGDIRNRKLRFLDIPGLNQGTSSKQFTREDMKAFGDHCRVVMNKGYSEVAMDALLDTWMENRRK